MMRELYIAALLALVLALPFQSAVGTVSLTVVDGPAGAPVEAGSVQSVPQGIGFLDRIAAFVFAVFSFSA